MLGDEPIWHNDDVIGWVTSGGYCHHQQQSVALGYIPGEKHGESKGFAIEILGDRRPAEMHREPLFDPK